MKSTRVDGKRSLCRLGYLLIWLIRLPGGFSITSTFLLCSRRTRELSFGTICTLTNLMCGFGPYQNGFAVMSISESFFRLVTMNGPLPTGLFQKLSPCALTSFAGTTAYAYMARSAKSGACGRVRRTTTVCASGAVTLFTRSEERRVG